MSSADSARFAEVSTPELERRLAQAELPPQEKVTIEEELTRRLVADILPPDPSALEPPEVSGPARAWAPPVGPPTSGWPQGGGPSHTEGAPPKSKGPPTASIGVAQPATPRRRRSVVKTLLAVMVVLVVVGWATGAGPRLLGNFQGTNGSPDPQPDTVTMTSWRAESNDYCRTVTDPQMKQAQSNSSTPDLRQMAQIQRTSDRYLRGLEMPLAVRNDVQQMTQLWDKFADFLEVQTDAFDQGDTAKYTQALTMGNDLNDAGNIIATRLGLDQCAGAGGL